MSIGDVQGLNPATNSSHGSSSSSLASARSSSLTRIALALGLLSCATCLKVPTTEAPFKEVWSKSRSSSRLATHDEIDGSDGPWVDALTNPDAIPLALLCVEPMMLSALGGGANGPAAPSWINIQPGLVGRAVGLGVGDVGASDLAIPVEVIDVGNRNVGFQGRPVGLGGGRVGGRDLGDRGRVARLPVSPISLPKKNTSLAARPVSAVALTITSSHFW